MNTKYKQELEKILNVRGFFPEGEQVLDDVVALTLKTFKEIVGKKKKLLSFNGSMSLNQWYEQLKQQTLKAGYNIAIDDLLEKAQKELGERKEEK